MVPRVSAQTNVSEGRHVAEPFPWPRMEDGADRMGAATYVTTLDLLKGHWQVPLTSRASDVSASVPPDAFWLRKASDTSQRLMNLLLARAAKTAQTRHKNTYSNIFKYLVEHQTRQ